MEDEIAKNIVPIIVMGTLGLFTFFGGVLTFIILYQKKVIRTQEEKQNMETQFQKDMLHNFIETQEKERQRIAADLHDNVGASLAAIKMMMNQVKANDEVEKEVLKECKAIIQSTADSTRQISHDLLPPSLDKLGLIKVLERMAKNISSKELQMKIISDETIKWDKNTELALFRISQEMMTNTLKYAKSNKIEIEIQEEKNSINYRYSDNGIGFDAQQSEGLGFKNIATRVEMIKGNHEFYSIANQKSGVNISIPTT